MVEMAPFDVNGMEGVVANAYHNGYIYSKIWLKTPHGNVTFLWDAGELEVLVNPDGFPDNLTHDPKVLEFLQPIVENGYDDEDMIVLKLYEEADMDTIKALDAILEKMGWNSPWVLDFETGELRDRYRGRVVA